MKSTILQQNYEENRTKTSNKSVLLLKINCKLKFSHTYQTFTCTYIYIHCKTITTPTTTDLSPLSYKVIAVIRKFTMPEYKMMDYLCPIIKNRTKEIRHCKQKSI